MTYFITKVRDNGDKLTTLTDSTPEWVIDAVREAHDGMMPDDYIYEWCSAAFNAYDDYNGDIDAAMLDIEAEPYYSALGAWFTSHMDRAQLVDDVLSELDIKDVYAAIGYAQVREKERVYGVIFEAIEENQE